MDCIIGFVQCLPIQDLPLMWRKTPPQTAEMISDDGTFDGEGLKNFMKFHECGVSYAVVAIMGPQSSGKSTILNNLFDTNFPVKEGESGERWMQNTRGIRIAAAPNMDPFTMVMDLDCTDYQEMGEDGTTFEKQIALFSLVVADILIINMWYRDIGRANATNWPLLQTIFEEMLRHFRSRPRKTMLQFVIRDHDHETETGIGDLRTKLIADVRKIWEIVTDNFKNTPLSEFFNVEVDALSHYKNETARFEEEVVILRKKIQGSIWLAGDRDDDDVPTSGFSLHAKRLWETIRQNKNLNLPTHKVATVRCEEIAMEKLRLFAYDQEWLRVEAAAEKRLVPGFSVKISSILNRYLSQYDAESRYFEESVRNSKRQNLETEAFKVVHPAFINTLGHLRTDALREFETHLKQLLSKGGGYVESVRSCQESCELDFDRRCLDAAIEEARWDASFVRRELVRDMQNHALDIRTHSLQQAVELHRARLGRRVARHLNRVFSCCAVEGISWPDIISFLNRECDAAASDLRSAVAEFDLDRETLVKYRNDLKQSARRLVVDKFKDETASVLERMQGSYIVSLANNEDPFPKCLKLLLSMVAIRLDNNSNDDNIERSLLSALMHGEDEVYYDLARYTWEKIPPEMILVTPVGCKDIWIQFKQDIESKISSIQSAKNKASPPSKPGGCCIM